MGQITDVGRMSKVVPIKPQHLPQFVGYGEVERALGVSRSTVERMVRDNKFPQPVQLAPNRVGWLVETVTAWLADRGKGLVAHAVAHPEDLAPDEVAPTIAKLAARLISQEFGEAVSPDQVHLTLSRSATNDEVTSCRAKLLGHVEDLCSHLTYDRALFIAASLFPAVRETFYKNGIGEPGVLRDPDVLRAFAIDILDDKLWAKIEAAKTKADEAALKK